jgi:hypothetical protein
MYVVKDGKIVWDYTMPQIGEYSDVSLLSNGDIIFARQHGASEVSPDKKMVWDFNTPATTEIHCCQPLGLDKVFLMFNSVPAKAVIIDKKTNTILKELIIPTAGTGTHGMFRHCRYTKDGTFLIAQMDMNKVNEYDENGKVIWSVNAMSLWAAVRLNNGNTFYSGNGYDYTREVNKKGETAWELSREDAKAQGVTLYTVQQACRLENGNTVIANWCGGGNLPEDVKNKSAQIIEITLDKKIVWVLSQWNEPKLGNAALSNYWMKKAKQKRGNYNDRT